jgi:hypothetical protein
MTPISSKERADAKHKASELTQRLPREVKAKDHELAGKLYVVTSSDDADFAYLAKEIDLATIAANGWNFAAWEATMKPVEDLEVAVHYFMETGRLGPNPKHRDLKRRDGSARLTIGQRAALKMFAKGNLVQPGLQPDQVDVLEIAESLTK